MRGWGAGVFPRPREMAVTGERGRPVEVAAGRDRRLPAQGYELRLGPDGTQVGYADDLGLRYARQTLAQLAAKAESVPEGWIRDWPDFAHRGFMLDISRDRVPTMASLEWMVTRLAELRYKHLELYTEHTFAYAHHEKVWRHASPITPAELRRLDQLCRDHGIELSANQNTLRPHGTMAATSQLRGAGRVPGRLGDALVGGADAGVEPGADTGQRPVRRRPGA
jgi:hexosaminidase